MVWGDMRGDWVWQGVEGGTGVAKMQIGGSWYCWEDCCWDRSRSNWLAGAGPRGTHRNAWRKLVQMAKEWEGNGPNASGAPAGGA